MEGGGPRSAVDRGYLAGLVAVLSLEAAGVLVQIVTGRPVPEITLPATVFAVACMVRDRGPRGAMSFGVLVFAIPFGSELLGVLTGIPYGPYAYDAMPGPSLFGIVPVFIYVAWLNIAYLAVATTTLAAGLSRFALALVDGAVAVAWDAMVDPLAVRAGYWTWSRPGGLYGVPLTNFLGWFAVVTVLSLAVRTAWSRDARAPARTSRVLAFIVPALLLGSALSFAALSFDAGFLWSGLIGLAVLVPTVGLAWNRVARMPSGLRAPSPWVRTAPPSRVASRSEERS
ncbi:MAG TPA: carotenoid biosynthesis protein [Thermoplasmata archaeon]|nr:carotenoid biosynthesis protein [Thermoplasmata archaeon]